MFARHTPTRMRGSGVVQSLKSLASKLHPQLPLSPKESQRLLTALTSSFRKQLDEAHPLKAQDEDSRPRLNRENASNPERNALHTSSVAFADKHLASVLTNPLLVKNAGSKQPILNEETAKLELEQNPDKDPILVLEEYNKQGAATIPIASLCLRNFRNSLASLNKEDRRQRVQNAKAGTRTLKWLWHSGLYDSDAFVDDRRLMSPLVELTIEEGNEHYLWSWVGLDERYGDQTKSDSIYHQYRWKAFMVRSMIISRWQSDDPKTLDTVFDTYFHAVDSLLGGRPIRKREVSPLTNAVSTINTRIFNSRRDRKLWDVDLYDRYMESMDLHVHKTWAYWSEYSRAQLRLTHPREPSPLPIYRSLRESFSCHPDSDQAKVFGVFSKNRDARPAGSKIKHIKYYILLETARQLQDLGHNEEMEWIVSQIHALFPEMDRYLMKNLRTGGTRKVFSRPDHSINLPGPGILAT